MSIERKAYKMIIELDNILPEDAIALKKMFEYMQYLGGMGSSRMCSFYADGDGSFRPKVKITYPIELPEVKEIDGIVKWDTEKQHISGGNRSSSYEGDFRIDSDSIAWRIYHDE